MNDTFPAFTGRMYYHRLDFRFSPVATVYPEAWIGAVLRNNLLYAAEQIPVGRSKSLFAILDEYPGKPDFSHPFYKEWAGGFPKGFSLGCPPFYSDGFCYPPLQKNKIFTFSLALIGHMVQYTPYLIEAVRRLCERGIGKPLVPLRLIDISEHHPEAGTRLLGSAGETTEHPQYPVRPDDFRPFSQKVSGRIEISLETPLCLVKKRQKADPAISYQDKQNGFPSFYQLIRSLAYRLLKLSVLYCNNGDYPDARESVRQIDEWIAQATNPELTAVILQSVTWMGPPRKENRARMIFTGYTGTMSYTGDFRKYLPLLLFAEGLGVGNDTVYGLGKYRITSY